MKKFFNEFKAFITRGNVLDMAVGVIVGGAFTAIVNGLSNFILKPIINFILAQLLGNGALEDAVLVLGKATYLADGKTLDLANTIYIDWGSFINAIINFLLIALVLFTIVKIINKAKGYKVDYCGYSKEDYKKLRKEGKSKAEIIALAKERDEKLAKEKAEKEALEKEEARKHSTEGLLESIKELLEKQAK
ncbi:MAG: large conductance mechanosensitive channel protein MscL [Clostridia bacterium]|nr:large conductance mechanosensitive channel protein MscL [Clostridia bacterium]